MLIEVEDLEKGAKKVYVMERERRALLCWTFFERESIELVRLGWIVRFCQSVDTCLAYGD